jgi:hypothetical protein
VPYKDRQKYLETQRSYYKKDSETYKWRVRFNKYGLTKEEFFNLLELQDNKCALCNKPFESLTGNNLHVDHDHETDKVRGLLCLQCNVGLGMLGDKEEGLLRALEYVRGELSNGV